MPININLEYSAPDVKRIEPFRLPVSPDDLRQRLDRLGFTPQVMDEIKIKFSLTDSLFTPSVAKMDSPETIVQMDELNYLAAIYDELDTGSKEKFKAVLEYIGHGFSRYPHEIGNISDTIDIILNLDKFVFYPDVQSIQQLGQRVIENNNQSETNIDLTSIPPNPDHSAIGQDTLEYDRGCFTSHGYVSGGGKGFEPVFLQAGVPDRYRVWEAAFPELPPFENPIKIDYESISESNTDEWQFNVAYEVFGHLVAVNHPNFSDGDHKHRAARIIELAEMVRKQDDALNDMLMDSILGGGMYGGEASELIGRISKPESGLDVQFHLERSYGIDNDFEGNYRDELMKLPPDLQFNEYIKVMMENRVRHQQTISELSGQEPPLEAISPEQLARFHMLPADKQAEIQLEQDVHTLYSRVKLDNARAMVNLYTAKIMEYLDEHIKNGYYDPEKIARATEIRNNLIPMAEKEYKCDPNRQPVVNIETYGCELFPVGKQYPFPVFNKMFSQAVEYYGLLHAAGVPLSQNLVYLNMDFLMESQPEQIKFHTDKAVLLFVDQGKSFMEQIAAAQHLEPVFREKLTAYLTMHLCVEQAYLNSLEVLPEAIQKMYPKGLPEKTIQLAPDGNSFIWCKPPDYRQQIEDFVTFMCEKINQRTEYPVLTFSEPLPDGDIPAIAQRYEALMEIVDPVGHEQYSMFRADAVAAAMTSGDEAKVGDYLETLGYVDGTYSNVAQDLAAAIERLPIRETQQERQSVAENIDNAASFTRITEKPIAREMTQPEKASIADLLARAKQAVAEQPSPPPKDRKKFGPEL